MPPGSCAFDLPVDADTFLRAFARWPRALYPGATALLLPLRMSLLPEPTP